MFEILKVKSLFKQYYVKQIEDLLDTLPLVLKDDDFIIIDQKVFDLFNPDLGAIEGHKHLIIEASEEKKSYLGIQPILS
ncbi:MAG: hypothetical protein NE328_20155, partial [Lentisphaeraceae bacterium]|nr:hypothetical protein [Lentisphaeraceae bacterium]